MGRLAIGSIASLRVLKSMRWRGEVSSAWELNNQEFQLVAQIPANTRATVRLPKAVPGKVNESGKQLTVGNGITAINESGDTVIVEVGAGRYVFAYAMTSAK
jgi:alpha-L-rhamnosidase